MALSLGVSDKYTQMSYRAKANTEFCSITA